MRGLAADAHDAGHGLLMLMMLALRPAMAGLR